MGQWLAIAVHNIHEVALSIFFAVQSGALRVGAQRGDALRGGAHFQPIHPSNPSQR